MSAWWKNSPGLMIGLLIVACWSVSLATGLTWTIDYSSPLLYLWILGQTHLYTGLFITAHDAMHGAVSKNRRLNKAMGMICSTLFSFNFYSRLFSKHHEHHRFVATGKDPDYHKGHFFPWYFNFLKQYITWQQLLLMAVTFNLLKGLFPTENVVLIWMLPAILSTLQLFYFGTYIPHKGNHPVDNLHKSRSQAKNHVWAFLSCYFFGYHYEHHASPATPWWRLYQMK